MPLQDDYLVTLETFKGPLDLLLYLIRRNEVDIHDIPIATITEQYLAFLRQIEHVDIELAGEFLVMAATLIEIKSRTLMPPEKREGEAGESTDGLGDIAGPESDPRYELVQQLLAYQRYRIASEELDARRREFAQRADVVIARPQAADSEPPPIELELEDAHVLDLSQAYEKIMASIDFNRMGDHTVEMDDTPIQLHQEDLLDQLGRASEKKLTLQETFAGRSRLEMIGLFLAMLELVRQRRIVVRQDRLNEAISVELNADPEVAAVNV